LKSRNHFSYSTVSFLAEIKKNRCLVKQVDDEGGSGDDVGCLFEGGHDVITPNGLSVVGEVGLGVVVASGEYGGVHLEVGSGEVVGVLLQRTIARNTGGNERIRALLNGGHQLAEVVVRARPDVANAGNLDVAGADLLAQVHLGLERSIQGLLDVDGEGHGERPGEHDGVGAKLQLADVAKLGVGRQAVLEAVGFQLYRGLLLLPVNDGWHGDGRRHKRCQNHTFHDVSCL